VRAREDFIGGAVRAPWRETLSRGEKSVWGRRRTRIALAKGGAESRHGERGSEKSARNLGRRSDL